MATGEPEMIIDKTLELCRFAEGFLKYGVSKKLYVVSNVRREFRLSRRESIMIEDAIDAFVALDKKRNGFAIHHIKKNWLSRCFASKAS